jgi:flagellin-like protein
LKTLFQSKKALSPVLSTVMMILIVVIGMSMLFAYFVNYAKDFQLGSGSSVLESMTIEDVWFKTPTSIELTVYNLGKVDSKITSIYLDDLPQFNFTITSISLHGQQIESTVMNPIIPINGHANITILLFPLGWSNRPYAYDLKIVTARGSGFEGKYLPPG